MRGGGITRWLCPPLRWLGRICRLHPVNSAKIRKFLGNTATMNLSCKKSNVFSFATASRRWRTLTVHEFLARVAADAFPTSSPVNIRHCSFLYFSNRINLKFITREATWCKDSNETASVSSVLDETGTGFATEGRKWKKEWKPLANYILQYL